MTNEYEDVHIKELSFRIEYKVKWYNPTPGAQIYGGEYKPAQWVQVEDPTQALQAAIEAQIKAGANQAATKAAIDLLGRFNPTSKRKPYSWWDWF